MTPAKKPAKSEKHWPLEPETREQWQIAVDAAVGARTVADCKMYGLLQGGPGINVEHCDDIMQRGRAIGIKPSRNRTDLALEFIAAVNREVE